MNDDGSPGVDADTKFGIKVGGLRGVGIGTLIFGIVIALVGLGLLIWGIRTPSRPAQPATQTARTDATHGRSTGAPSDRDPAAQVCDR